VEQSQYNRLAKEVYDRVFAAFDDIDPDVAEADQALDNIKILFANGTQFILNRQSAVQQIWLATKKRGYHFNFDEKTSQWICDHTGSEFFALLTEEIRGQMGGEIQF